MTLWKRALTGCAILAAVPVFLLGLLLGPLYRAWVERRARQGAWGPRRDFSFSPPDEWSFSWMARSDEEACAALCDAVAAIVRALPAVLQVPAVEHLEILNPSLGFALCESHLGPITKDFGPEVARLLHGERAELVTLVVNGLYRLSLDLDARSFVAGHLSISLGASSPAGVIAELKRAYEIGLAAEDEAGQPSAV